MEKLPRIFLTLCLFILDIIYSFCIILLLQKVGINIETMTSYMKYIYKIGIDISFMLILLLLYRKDIINNFINYFRHFFKNIKIGFKYWLLGLAIMVVSNLVISQFMPGGPANEEAVQSTLQAMPFYMLFATVIYAPFVEEIIFRKSIRDFIKNDYLYVLISGFVFGYAHTLAGNSPLELLYVIPYGALGSCFAYMYVKTKNIFVPITFHMLHNGIIVFVSLISYLVVM